MDDSADLTSMIFADFQASEGLIQPLVQDLAGRVVAITATGAKLWDVDRNPDRRLCIIEISSSGNGFYILFGNKEYGLIPSIETPSHLLANAINVKQGLLTSSSFHAHPEKLVAVGSHVLINDSYGRFNKTLYTQKEGVLTNAPDLIGVVAYHPSGSKALLEESSESIINHRITLWSHHGVLIRERSVERCVDLLEYSESAAISALDSLLHPKTFQGLTESDIKRAIKLYGLDSSILRLLRGSKK